MLDAKDLELIVEILKIYEDDTKIDKEEKVSNLIDRLEILIAQDKANMEYREKMEQYSKQLKELIEPLEK